MDRRSGAEQELSGPQRIDVYLPTWDENERHAVEIRASLDRVYATVRSLDLSASFVIRWLFRLRGLPASDVRLETAERMGFVLLDEVPNRELVLGLVGRFWSLTGGIRRVAAAEFIDFAEPGYARAAWNFTLEELEPGRVRLTTETRIHCTDPASRRSFRRYWRLIRPFSGLIRREMLRAIRMRAEGSPPPAVP